MISEKQIEANKQNAQKSTGAKTEVGKNIVKLNALKHGLLSSEVLLKDENKQELDEMSKKIRNELAPANQIELILVERIIANTWRLKRAMRIEAEMIKNDCTERYLGAKNLGEAFSQDFANNDTYGKFTRYETSIERGIYKALHELQRLQAGRKGKNIPLPLAVDIDMFNKE